MIVSDITNWEKEAPMFPKIIGEAIEHIRGLNFETMQPGTYPIRGESLFLMYQQDVTKLRTEIRPESHETYADIQFLLSGEERIGVSRDRGDHVVTEDLMSTKDVAFYSGMKDECDIVLRPGAFVVLFPGEIHRPRCAVQEGTEIRKAVVKIHKDLLFAPA